MLTFRKLDKDVLFLRDFFEKSDIEFCDISVGVKFMWREDYTNEYVIFNETLILKESCPFYNNAFYFPMGKDIDGALSEIESYCKQTNTPLVFCCIDNSHSAFLSMRYDSISISNLRDWSDYLYDAEAFKSFVGKKYSGQRNHINKFKKNYPNYIFKKLQRDDLGKIKDFLLAFEPQEDFSAWSAKEEEKKVLEFVENSFDLGQVGGYIEVDGKIVAFSIGERVKDCLIVHIEKGLKTYEGVYPTMANEFAKCFAVDGVKTINREEDCGDLGLRISKLQYHPMEVKEKNTICIFEAHKKMVFPIEITTQRLTITEIKEQDKQDYYNLYTDDELNKFYGYDYKKDLNGKLPSGDYFFDFQNQIRESEHEFSFAVRLNGKMIGEIVLYNFGFFGDAELGFRFFKEYQGFGYAFEGTSAIIDYAKSLSIKKLHCRANVENIRSINLIYKLGFISETSKEKGFKYFCKILKN